MGEKMEPFNLKAVSIGVRIHRRLVVVGLTATASRGVLLVVTVGVAKEAREGRRGFRIRPPAPLTALDHPTRTRRRVTSTRMAISCGLRTRKR